MGSPYFSLPSLRLLAANYPVVGVITQPDRPAGRGRELAPPPVKRIAQQLGIPVIQPQRLKEPQTMQILQDWGPDVIVVVAFGQILRPAVLNLPEHGCINVHASLLPRWRGAAPVQAAILHGDQETGATIMRMDQGVDTGPILSQRTISIDPHETGGILAERLSDLGAQLLLETLPGYLQGTVQPQPQVDAGVTYASMLKKEDGALDFSQPADALARRVRAFNPWPGTYTTWNNQPLKIHRAHKIQVIKKPIGTKTIYEGFPAVACFDGLLVLDEVQPAGKRSMPGQAFLRGARDWGSED